MPETNQLSYVFVIFFLTLGPLKVIPVFHRLTLQTTPNFRKSLAQKAFLLSCVIILGITTIGEIILASWDVSTAALYIAGGLLLLLAALQILFSFTLPKSLSDVSPSTDADITPLAINPLTIPTIITPYGIVAILVAIIQAEKNVLHHLAIFVFLLLIMCLNWLGMTFATIIIQRINLISLLISGWILAVLQAGLAIDIMIQGIKKAKVFF